MDLYEYFFDSFLFPFECFTTGENTKKFLTDKNTNYISVVIAILGVVNGVTNFAYFICDYLIRYERDTPFGFVFAMFFQSVALGENILGIVLYYKFKAEEKRVQRVSFEDDTINDDSGMLKSYSGSNALK